jgi:hypothetical protein
MPFDHCPRNSERSSVIARRGVKWAHPMAMNAASQLHWWGYGRGEGRVQVPRSSLRRTRIASAASASAAPTAPTAPTSLTARPR